MPEQDPSTGEVQHSDEVVDVTFPAGDQPPEVVQPGKEAFDLPAPTCTPQAAAILRDMPATAAMGRDHLDAVRRHQGFVERIAVVAAIANQPRREVREEAASRVAGTRCGSYGEALATCTAIGRPWRSQIAMILLPLPRRVGPTAEPLFSPRRTWRRRRLRRDRFFRGPANLPRAAAAATPAGRIVATVGNVDGRSDTADSDGEDRAMVRRCARSRGPRSARHADQPRAVRVRLVGDADGRSVRGQPTACRPDP